MGSLHDSDMGVTVSWYLVSRGHKIVVHCIVTWGHWKGGGGGGGGHQIPVSSSHSSCNQLCF